MHTTMTMRLLLHYWPYLMPLCVSFVNTFSSAPSSMDLVQTLRTSAWEGPRGGQLLARRRYLHAPCQGLIGPQNMNIRGGYIVQDSQDRARSPRRTGSGSLLAQQQGHRQCV